MADLLAPFLPAPAAPELLRALETYLDLLLRWNQRINLTAVRDEENIVIRHFGESLFAAYHLLGDNSVPFTVHDVGSGAGFPGLPLKLYARAIRLTLIEAHGKKATFLREAARTLRLRDVTVLNQRAESVQASSDLVTLRAVEDFSSVLPFAALLVGPHGRLALLIGSSQLPTASAFLPAWHWDSPRPIPHSSARVLLVGRRMIDGGAGLPSPAS